MQKEIVIQQPLLDTNGNIANPGYAKELLWKYDRQAIKASPLRIKEWDYYYIGNQDYGLALTLSDVGYVSCLSISFMTYGSNPIQYNDSALGILPLGKLHLPNTSEIGDVAAKVGNADMHFLNDGKARHLYGSFKNFAKSGKTLTFDVVLSDFPKQSMVIATPFNKDKHFYYNQKINCMKANGNFKFEDKIYTFNKNNQSLATLDWGRGVWTYDNTWYWGSGSMYLENGDLFGFNIGYGFGDTSLASENMLFYNGTSHKLEDVYFNIPKDAGGSYLYTDNWTFTSSDSRFEMSFEPIIDRQAPTDLKIIAMIPHQVFGKMSGKAILDDGKTIIIKDKLVFAEHVHNKW